MAAPRIFVSSTYYDLRYVRADLEHFEREWKFDLVLFERGNIPYDGSRRLEESCLEEIDKCDIVVSIIGGRYGSTSKVEPELSISRREVEYAVNSGRQLFVFVEQNVHSEFETYLQNVEQADRIRWRFVETVQVFEFIQYIKQLPSNNAVFAFETSQELMATLRDQLTGLFQSMLQQQRRGRVDASANKLIEAVETLDKVVEYLKAEKSAERRAMDDILFSRHPVFGELSSALDMPIRLIFEDLDELEAIFNYAGFTRVVEERELSLEDSSEYFFWAGRGRRVGVSRRIFGNAENENVDGRVKLLPISEQESRVRLLVVVR